MLTLRFLATNTADRFPANPAPGFGFYPVATIVNASGNNAPLGTVNVTGWTYLLAKYGGDSYVWYVGGLSGNQSVPLNNATGQGHWTSRFSILRPMSLF